MASFISALIPHPPLFSLQISVEFQRGGINKKITNVIFSTTQIFYADFAFFRAAEIISDCCLSARH